MKTKLFQLYTYFNSIDRRYLQWAYFVLMLALYITTGSTEDGGSGTRRV